MSDVDISRERIERLKSMGVADYLHIALLDRIEELEAKLAKAVEALQDISDGNPTIDCPEADAANSAALARAALRAIEEGGK